MLETFTPAVCGSRQRQIVAQGLFGVSAVLSAAALGLLLGLVGGGVGGRWLALAAAALALVAAAREAGLLRFAIPQSRRQVPERWRFELPLPVWASGYGAGLGAGFFTFQPVSTYWVACAAALALGRPLPAALCFSLYGAGRALLVVWPRRRESDPTEAVERLVRRQGALLRANVVALVAGAALLVLASPAGAAVPVATGALDPSVSGPYLAYATKDGSVVVRQPDAPDVVFPDASQPALHGAYLAYVDADGIRVVNWQTDTEVGRIANPNASRPALSWPQLAFVRQDPKARRLVVANLDAGTSRVISSVKLRADLGRPSLRHGRVAWHAATPKMSRINVYSFKAKKQRVVATTSIGLLTSPSIHQRRVVWVDARSGATHLRAGWVHHKRNRRTIATVKSRNVSFWTTSLRPGQALWTRWTLSTGGSSVWAQSL